MALIYCKNCGHRISDLATACPHCGTLLAERQVNESHADNEENMIYQAAVICLQKNQLQEASGYVERLLDVSPDNPLYQQLRSDLEEAEERMEEKREKVKKTVITVAALLAILVVAIIAYNYINYKRQQNEQAFWNQIENSEKIENFENYLENYPNGEHRSTAEQRLSSLKEVIATWNRIKDIGNESELESFIESHPHGYYHDLAVDAYDELLWNKAVSRNEQYAYNDYMEKCPQGKHYKQAVEKSEYLARMELTYSEKDEIGTTIRKFLNALARGNEDALLSCLNSTLTSFLGKTNATKVDAIRYMKQLHAQDVYSVNINMDETLLVKKDLIADTSPIYTVTFYYDQHLNREDTSLETFASLTGNAVLNNRFKITSLTIKKTAHY